MRCIFCLCKKPWWFPWPDFGQPFPALAASQLADRLVQPFREELSQAAGKPGATGMWVMLPLCPAPRGRQQGVGIRGAEVQGWEGKLGNCPFCPEPGARGKELGREKGGWQCWKPCCCSPASAQGLGAAHRGHSQRWGRSRAWLSLRLSLVSQTQLLIKPGCKWSGDN